MMSSIAPANEPERIVLTGFMGAGKSTVGPLLAHLLGWRFIDADHYLQDKMGMSISAMFAEYGELRFRQMEAEALSVLNEQRQTVIALGGGAVETEAVRALLGNSSDTWLVFLDAPLEVLVARCEQQSDAAVRPVLRDRDTLNQRFASRLSHYRRAHVTVSTQDLAPEAIAERIFGELAKVSRHKPGMLKDPVR